MKECPGCRKPHDRRTIFCTAACYHAQPISNETRARMSAAGNGKPKSAAHAANISAGQKKIAPLRRAQMLGPLNFNWGNKAQGTPEGRANLLNGMATRPPMSDDWRRRHSETMRGPANAMRGKAHSEAAKIAVSATKLGLSVESWAEFSSSADSRERASTKFAEWRQAVFARDEYTCAMCGRRGGSLHAHHIKLFSRFPDLRYVVSNGITLCGTPCHRSLRRKEEQFESQFVSIVASRVAVPYVRAAAP